MAVVPIALGSTDARRATNPILNRLVLKGPQVGAGYKLVQRPDGHGARGYVTLDMCGFVFPSENLRTDRLQVNYKRAGTAVELSNEVVSYRPGGAAQSLQEIGGRCGSVSQGARPFQCQRSHRADVPAHPAPHALDCCPVTWRSARMSAGSTRARPSRTRRSSCINATETSSPPSTATAGTLASRTKTTLFAAEASARNLSG